MLRNVAAVLCWAIAGLPVAFALLHATRAWFVRGDYSLGQRLNGSARWLIVAVVLGATPGALFVSLGVWLWTR